MTSVKVTTIRALFLFHKWWYFPWSKDLRAFFCQDAVGKEESSPFVCSELKKQFCVCLSKPPYRSISLTFILARSQLSRGECRLRVCVVQNVLGSSPGPPVTFYQSRLYCSVWVLSFIRAISPPRWQLARRYVQNK